MSTITDPILLDSTGQDIKDEVAALNTKIQALNDLLANLGLVSITPISQEDYDALSQAEKLAGVFDIYDAVEPNIDGTKVAYDSNTSVNDKIDDIDQKINNVIYENIIDNPIVVAYGTTETGNLKSGKYLSGYNMIIGILYDNEYIRGSFVVSRNATNFNFSNIFSVWYGGNVANGAFKHTSDTTFTITNNSSVSLNFMLRGIKLN